jgi:hypothetical protein
MLLDANEEFALPKTARTMDTDAEFEALGLSRAEKSRAWEARARIIWGDSADDARMSLVAQGMNGFTADEIVALAVRERALAIRVKGIRDLVLGVLAGAVGAGVGIGTYLIVQNDVLGPIPFRALAAIVVGVVVAFGFALHFTWRGLLRVIGGARVRGSVSDVDG